MDLDLGEIRLPIATRLVSKTPYAPPSK